MELKAIQKEFHQRLDHIYNKNEVDSFFFMALDHYYDLKRITLALQPELTISNKESKSIFKVLEALEKEKPIQYILGETIFCGFPFKMKESVLIPRPETEELVEWIVNEADSSRTINILDIGTGSGCIAIALAKKLTNAKVYALDISSEALKIARENALINNVTIKFIEADILDSKKEFWNLVFGDLNFDLIVSNPPYIKILEKEHMKNNVVKHEPHLALFVDDEDALLFYRKIARLASKILTKKGELYFEINEYLGESVIELLKVYKFVDLKLKQDIFKKNRMIKAARS